MKIEGDRELKDWKQVRHIPAKLEGWQPEKDELFGTEKYGNSEDNSKAWAIPFDDFNVKRLRVESLDMSYSKEYSP